MVRTPSAGGGSEHLKEEDGVTGLVETLADSVQDYFNLFLYYSELISVPFDTVTPAGVFSLLVSSLMFSGNKYLRKTDANTCVGKWKYTFSTTTNLDFARKRVVRCQYMRLYLCSCLFCSSSETFVSCLKTTNQRRSFRLF